MDLKGEAVGKQRLVPSQNNVKVAIRIRPIVSLDEQHFGDEHMEVNGHTIL